MAYQWHQQAMLFCGLHAFVDVPATQFSHFSSSSFSEYAFDVLGIVSTSTCTN